MNASDQGKHIRIGILGSGRLGTALAWSLSQAGWRVHAVSSRHEKSAQQLASSISGGLALSPQELANACDLVFIATTDSAIEEVARSIDWRTGMSVVHCSGATEVEALRKAADDGAQIGGFHPMQTFGDPAAAMASLPGCTITIEAENPLLELLENIVLSLGCRVNRLPAGMRGRYHAAAGYTSQFINALFDQAITIWSSWGASPTDALQALLPLAHGTLASIKSAGIARGMPGPVSRGDVKSIAKHLQAIGEMDPDRLPFYVTLCAATVPISLSAQLIDANVAKQFENLLQQAQKQLNPALDAE